MKIIVFSIFLFGCSIIQANDFCTELDKETLFNQSQYVIDIEITGASLKPDSARHELAKAVEISFEELNTLKKAQSQLKSLRYESPFIPSNGQSLALFKKGSQYRIFFDDATEQLNIKPCRNIVPLNVSL